MYAIIETGGKQLKVEAGDAIFVEKLEVEAGEKAADVFKMAKEFGRADRVAQQIQREIAVIWLHQKRATSVEALYTALVDLQHSVHVVLGIFSPRNPSDIRKYTAEAFKRTQDVYSGYLKAKIFMAPLTCEKIERVLDGLQNPLVMYYGFLGNYDDRELNTLSDVKEDAWKKIRDSVPPALIELEAEFRQLLGVENG